MTGYVAYQRYKSSGIDWLGDVPDHWKVIRIKHLTPVKRGASPRPIDDPAYFDEDGEFAWVRIADVSASDHYLEATTQRLSETGENLSVKRWPGDLFLSIAGTVGKPIISKIKCCIHDGFVYFPDFKGSNEFLYYIFACGQPYLGLGKMGTQLNLNTDTVGSILIGLPPSSEQQAIVKFLDFKTAQIDSLIAKKKTLLEKLTEKRTALINRAVTKGLDPTVAMKASGVEWLGEIPKRWSAKKVKYLGTTRYGLGEPPQKLDGGIPFIRATDIYRGKIDGSKIQMVDPESVPWSRNPALKGKDILVVRSGAYTGDSAIVPPEWAGAIAGYDMVYTSEAALPEYVAFNLLSKHVLNGQIYLAKSRAAQPHLNAEELGAIIIAVPPPEIQQRIVDYLEEAMGKIQAHIEKVISAIECLQEYRSALITHAVTGKIDVRDFPTAQLYPPTKEAAHD